MSVKENLKYHTNFQVIESNVPPKNNRSKYKLDCAKQQEEWLNSLGYYTVAYIGYCADEEKRFSKRALPKGRERYPLVEEGVLESSILEWAKTEPTFNHYYETNRRCGCMYCPMSSYLNYAYLCKYYPDNFFFMIEKMRETEAIRERESLVDRFRSFPQTRSTTPTTWRTSSKPNGSKSSMKWR